MKNTSKNTNIIGGKLPKPKPIQKQVVSKKPTK